MFEADARPRVFAMAPGVDFTRALADGILERMAGWPPEDLARVTVLVNSGRMARRLSAILGEGPARLLPKIALVTDLETLAPVAELPPPRPPLRRRLDLVRLLRPLLESPAPLAPAAAVHDLAESLSQLLDEIAGEGIAAERIEALDAGDASEHWDRSLRFLSIVLRYLEDAGEGAIEGEARRRAVVAALEAEWATSPPQTPVILAGSTGSRGTTARLMAAVARLPQGALVLPGLDRALPETVWEGLTKEEFGEDHPQYRLAALLNSLDLRRDEVGDWGPPPPDAARNALVSLSLRPAPATHQWRSEGPSLGDLRRATANVTLVEAASPRDEANAIAVALRRGIDDGRRAALITPDQTLVRRVSASLQRWGIFPDDSAGQPLSLTPPGRFLLQIADLMGSPAASDALIALLKHPFTLAGAGRVEHLRATRRFELRLRRSRAPIVDTHCLNGIEAGRWRSWLGDVVAELSGQPGDSLSDLASRHIDLVALVAGPDAPVWERDAGIGARRIIDTILGESGSDDPMTPFDYRALLRHLMSRESVRAPETPRADVMIWGPREARTQGADLVVLGGLNEGVWPARPGADPWLNRAMRKRAGLLLPDREIGLAAHDYQQAVAARTVVLCRATRDAEAPTVPSRWLNRLTNLLQGLPGLGGDQALAGMRERGDGLLEIARALDRPETREASAPRPAPAPDPRLRPTRFSVTEIKYLIRDPYAVYAKRVLRLRRLNPLNPGPDAAIRGEVFHDLAKRFVERGVITNDALIAVGEEVLAEKAPWPAARAIWIAHLREMADWLVTTETALRQAGQWALLEGDGSLALPGTPFTLTARADRIDRLAEGGLAVFDYKTGAPPTPKQVAAFDRQLPLEAIIAEGGGFEGLDAAPVRRAAYLQLSRTPKIQEIALAETRHGDLRTVTIQGELATLLSRYAAPATGYASRRAMEKVRYEGDYDHLARFGEWDESQTPVVERMT